MKYRIWVLPLVMLGLMATSGPVCAGPGDSNQQIAKREGDAGARRHDVVEGPHVEGHIAFLHTELGITPDQESLWAPVAAAMRQDVQILTNAQDKVESQTEGRLNTLQYLQNRVYFAQLRAQGEVRFLTALTPLYNNLSAHQKEMADELLIPHGPEDHP